MLFSPERFFVSLAAENYFGLSTQVPMKIVFVFKDKTMATLCLALKSICNGHVTDGQKTVLRNFLNNYILEHDIKGDLKLMPQWIQKLINELIKDIES